MKQKTTLAILLLLSPLLYPAISSPQWKVRRANALRNAYISGHSNLETIAPKFRYYIGGKLSRYQYSADDVNNDGVKEVVYTSGGKLIAKLSDDTIVWETPPMSLDRIWAVKDINSDGFKEIAVSARLHKVYLFDGRDGRVVWELPDGEIAVPVIVQFHDFNGDGFDDIYISDCYCCTVQTDKTIAISFAGDFSVPETVFYLARPGGCGIKEDTLADVDGDGVNEMITVQHFSIMAFNIDDGSLKYDSGNVGCLKYNNILWVEDVDSNGLPELFIFTNYYREGTPRMAKRVLVMEFDPSIGNFATKWEFAVGDVVNDKFKYHHRSVCDINGDGAKEVTVSIFDASTSAWTLYVLDAADGTIVDFTNNEELMGLADIDGDGDREILAMDEAGNLDCLELDSSGTIIPLWEINQQMVINVIRRDLINNTSAFLDVLTIDVDSDTIQELVTTLYNEEGNVPYLIAWNGELTPPTEAARFDPPPGTKALTWEVFEGVTRPYPQILLAQNDGYLIVLDNSFGPTNVSFDPDFPMRGMRIGGYYGYAGRLHYTPIIAPEPDIGRTGIYVNDSRGATLKLDPFLSDMINPPRLLWEAEEELHPTAVDINGDGMLEVVTVSRDRVIARNRDGTVLWSTTVASSNTQKVDYDPLAGDANGDGTSDIFYSLFDYNGVIRHLNVLNGSDGAKLWPSDVTEPISWGTHPFSIGDFNGNGTDDLIVVNNNLKVYEGSNSSLIGQYDTFTAYDLPMGCDYDSDGQLEIILQGGYFPVRLIENDFTPVWIAPVDRYTGGYGVIVECTGVKKYVTSKFNSCILRRFDLSTGAMEEEKCFATGVIYATEEDAKSAGAIAGYLSPVSGHQDITGTDTPSVIFGSTDGWLYIVDGCSFTILSSYNMRYPVGEPVIGDIDNDGNSEILALIGNGYLYAFDREEFPAPQWVYENDGTGPAMSEAEDIDEIETYNTLWANWHPVPGAISYEYAVLTSGGSIVTFPEWVNVGGATEAMAFGLPLRLGGSYLFAVRAIGPTGSSVETVSDGVTIVDNTPPQAIVTAEPESFCASNGATTTLRASLTDRTCLYRYMWQIKNSSMDIIVQTDYEPLDGASHEAVFVWDGNDSDGNPAPEGDYIATVIVEDVGGHIASFSIPISIFCAEEIEETLEEIVEQNGELTEPEPEQVEEEGRIEPAEIYETNDVLEEADATDVFEVAEDAREEEIAGSGGGCGCYITG